MARWYYAEPIMLMTMLSSSLLLLVVQSLVYEKKCTELFKDCSFLHSKLNSSQESEQRISVQRSSDMILTLNLLLSFVTPIVSTFIFGLLIDYGQYKISFILPLLGCLFGNLLLIGVGTFQLDLKFIYLSSFLMFLFGGSIVVILACFSYITVTATNDTFLSRVIIGEIMIIAGTFLGNLIGGYMADNDLLLYSFLVSLFFYGLSLLLACLGVPDLPNPSIFQLEKPSLASELKRVFTFVREKRPRQKYIVAYLSIYSLIVFISNGFVAVSYLYLVNVPFLMSNQLYGAVTSIIALSGVILSIFGAHVLIGRYNMLESTFCLLACVSTLAGFLMLGLGHSRTPVYIGALFISCLRTLSAILKSMLAKTVEYEERGRLFSIVLQCHNIVSLVSGTLSFAIYNALLSVHSTAICFIFFGLSCIVLAFFIGHRIHEYKNTSKLQLFC